MSYETSTVHISFSGTADLGTDYTLSGDISGTTVSFAAGITSRTFHVVPLYDTECEAPETVIATIASSQDYIIDPPGRATVTILDSDISCGRPEVTVAVEGSSTIAETSTTPAKFKLERTTDATWIEVGVAFSGTATFAVDYEVVGLNANGKVEFFWSQGTAEIEIWPILDSRAEGNETVIVQLLEAPDHEYTLGVPASATITITDNTANQMPWGWEVIDLASGSGVSAGYGINNVPGAPYWVQVAGTVFFSTSPTEGFKWDNGFNTLWPPVNFGSYGNYPPWAMAFSINNAGLSVGHAGTYDDAGPGSPFYHQQACYWPSGWNYGVALPFDSFSFTADSPENNATDVNQSGIIVGNMATTDWRQQAVYWAPDGNGDYDAMSSLGDLGDGSLRAYASAVNNDGITVGRSETSSSAPGKFRAFRSTADNGLPETLFLSDDMGTATMVEGHQSWANDINNLGELVGVSSAPGGFRAMYKAPRTGKDHGWYNLGVLGQGTADAGDWSEAFAINDKGLIVGRSRVKVSQQFVLRAFVVSNEGHVGSQPMINLNNRAYINGGFQSAASDGWLLTSADRINAGNWIIANGSKNGNPRAILLRPILNDPYQ